MAYDAKAIQVMIASPGDVKNERDIVRKVIADWNAIYSRNLEICLMPVGWETHSSPDLSGRPQQMINDRILEHCDLLIGIFWTRVGSPTGKNISGSIEEIEEHLAKDKPVMLYFSSAPVAPDNLDQDQFAEVKKFKEWAYSKGIVQSYNNEDDFEKKFARELPIILNDNPYFKELFVPQLSSNEAEYIQAFTQNGQRELSDDAKSMLIAAAEGNKMVTVRKHFGGTSIHAGNQTFGEEGDRRSEAKWEAVVDELFDFGLLNDINGKRELFQMNHEGFKAVDAIS